MSHHLRESPELDLSIKLHTGQLVGIRALAEALPHGSGIDAQWRVNQRSKNVFVFHNSYHRMNENGMYCGWRDFAVVVSRAPKSKFVELKGPCEGRCQITTIKGDWGYRITGLSGRLDDVGAWIAQGLEWPIRYAGFTRDVTVDRMVVKKHIRELEKANG